MIDTKIKIAVLDILKQLITDPNLTISLLDTDEIFKYIITIAEVLNIELEYGPTYYDYEHNNFVYEIRLKR